MQGLNHTGFSRLRREKPARALHRRAILSMLTVVYPRGANLLILKRDNLTSSTRIPARRVQAIIPPLNSFLYIKVHRTKKIIFLLYFTIEVCIQAQTRASRDLTDLTIDQTRIGSRAIFASETFSFNFAWHSIVVLTILTSIRRVLTYIFMKLNEETRRGAHTSSFFNNALIDCDNYQTHVRFCLSK